MLEKDIGLALSVPWVRHHRLYFWGRVRDSARRLPLANMLGSVRKVLPYSPQGTGRWDRRLKTFCELVETRNEAAPVLRRSEHALHGVLLPIWGDRRSWVRQLEFTLHASKRSNGLNTTPITVPTQSLSILALVGPTAIGSVCEDGHASLGCKSYQVKVWHGNMLACRLTAVSEAARHWRRLACWFW